MLDSTSASTRKCKFDSVPYQTLHCCCQESKDWASQAQSTYRNGQQNAQDPAIYTPLASAGLRTQLVSVGSQSHLVIAGVP